MKNLLFPALTISVLALTGCTEDSLTPSLKTVTPRAHTTAFAYVSSNTSGTLAIYPVGAAIANPSSVTGSDARMIGVPYPDADGVVYDANRNTVYQVNRSNDALVAIANIDLLEDGEMSSPSAMGPSTFTQGREATIYNNKVIVADDVTPGRLVSYHVNNDNISDYRWHDVGFEVWGIQMSGKDLWAIVDESNMLAMFEDYFKAQSGPLSATAMVGIEGLVRTHGLNYDEDSDVMVLTDIGDAGSGTDGGLIIIEDFSSKWWNAVSGTGMISMDEQIRVYGPSTELGNPVDVAMEYNAGLIFVAERKTDGGKFLVFETPVMSGEYAPIVSAPFEGASAVTVEF